MIIYDSILCMVRNPCNFLIIFNISIILYIYDLCCLLFHVYGHGITYTKVTIDDVNSSQLNC